MGSHLWFFCALFSAILWGFGYVLSEKVMDAKVSPYFLFVIETAIGLPLFLLACKLTGRLKSDVEILTANTNILLMAVLFAVTFALGSFLILYSISLKNATMANIVEISYPIFTFLFAWLLFKDVQLNMAAALGGLLIFSGIAVIYLKG